MATPLEPGIYKQRVVTLPRALESRLHAHLAKQKEKHVQDLLGHTGVSTTMIYLHVMKRSGAGGPSPLDLA